MAVKIRLARAGTTNRPFYHIVATNATSRRDGRFLEKLGTYNPLEAKTSENRFKFNPERLNYWLSTGAQPTDLVARQLVKAGVLKESKKISALRDKAIKRRADAKAAEEAKAKAEADAAAAAEAAANAPAEAPAAAAAPETPAA